MAGLILGMDSQAIAVVDAIHPLEANPLKNREAKRNLIIEGAFEKVAHATNLSEKKAYIEDFESKAQEILARGSNKADIEKLNSLYKKIDETSDPKEKAAVIAEINSLFEKNAELVETRAYLVVAKAFDAKEYGWVYISKTDSIRLDNDKNGHSDLDEIRKLAHSREGSAVQLKEKCEAVFENIASAYYNADPSKSTFVIQNKGKDDQLTVQRIGYYRFKVVGSNVPIIVDGGRSLAREDIIEVPLDQTNPPDYLMKSFFDNKRRADCLLYFAK